MKKINKTKWVSRGFISRIGLRFDLLKKPIKIALIILVIAAISPFVISQIEFQYKEYKYKQTLVSRDKLDRSRFELEMKEKERKEKEYQRWLTERKKEEIEQSNEIYKQKEVSKWNYIDSLYPNGTYILNIDTMEKGRITKKQGERLFTDMGWWIDVNGSENLEIIGYREYAKYKKYLEGKNER